MTAQRQINGIERSTGMHCDSCDIKTICKQKSKDSSLICSSYTNEGKGEYDSPQKRKQVT